VVLTANSDEFGVRDLRCRSTRLIEEVDVLRRDADYAGDPPAAEVLGNGTFRQRRRESGPHRLGVRSEVGRADVIRIPAHDGFERLDEHVDSAFSCGLERVADQPRDPALGLDRVRLLADDRQ
jgi:hypothetical protein